MADNRIPSLDGARAISIGLVIVAHLDLGRYVPGLWRLDAANLGVRVFFVISGFIITRLLLTELQRTGVVSLTAFYRRRVFRILPAFYTFLATVVLIAAVRGDAGTITRIWPAAIFIADYANTPLVVGHTWSLAVEEQFYLLWPIAIATVGIRSSYVGCIAMLLLAPLFRLLADLGVWPTNPRYAFECVADALAVGCLLAILRTRLWESSVYRRIISSPISLLPLSAAILFVAIEQDTGILYYTIGISALNVGIAIALDYFMRIPESLIGRFLNLAPIVWLGYLSYSLYLWQQLVASVPIATPWKVVLMLGCAAISYYVIELPFQRLRRRIEARTITAAVGQKNAG
jgi:peptidoglycan/LPS O-acetylase OafA/YrhL